MRGKITDNERILEEHRLGPWGPDDNAGGELQKAEGRGTVASYTEKSDQSEN